MKHLVALTILLTLGMAASAFADGMNQVVSATTKNPEWRVVVFNDSGSALTSGAVVVWDNDDTEFDRTGYPYVTTTTTADSPWTAGVIEDNSCPDQALCSMIVYGPARTNAADSTDAVAEDTLVSTSSVAGQAGDYGTGANTCALGMLLEDRNLDTGGGPTASDLKPVLVFVDVDCN